MVQLRGRVAGALTAIAAVAVVGLSAAPASAATTYSIAAGGSSTTVTVTNSGTLVFEDTYSGPFGTAGNPRVTCTSFNSTGTVKPGSHAFTAAPPVTDSAAQLAPVFGNLSGCTNVTVGPVTVTPSGTWKLGLASKTTSGGTVTGGVGYLSGVKVHFRFTVGAYSCDTDVTGALGASYSNGTGNLVFDPTYGGLTFSNVTNTPSGGSLCATVGWYDGDPGVFAGTLHLSPAPIVS